MKINRTVTGNILITMGLILLVCAGGLFFFNMLENNTFDEESNGLTSLVKSGMNITPESNNVPESNKASVITSEYVPEQKVELVPVQIGDGVFDGILAIPVIDLEMSVYDTWNEDYLRESVCRYYGSPYTDDFIIAGHNYRSGFGKLKELQPGDAVFFTDMSGNVTNYIVKEIEILDGTDISGMISGEWALSLYTCTYGGSARLTVRCEKV